MNKNNYRYIDLFAGLGGFHLALEQLGGGKCVFASELKKDLQDLYHINYPKTPIIEGDITQVDLDKIPSHDILCAGFPCQPFSQAGKRQGFDDEKQRGNLFDYICAILEKHRPEYVLLENVANLKGHDHGRTWKTIHQKLIELNYDVAEPAILSPHQFGIPQHRRRIYIVCRNKDYGTLDGFSFPIAEDKELHINDIIDSKDKDYIPLKPDTRKQLEVWEEFLHNCIKHNGSIPSFPIWAMEFGASYEYEALAPAYQPLENLRGCKGKFGVVLSGNSRKELLGKIPVYAQTTKTEEFPKWKKKYIQENRRFYERNKEWLDPWIEKVKDFSNSHLKLEWNCGSDVHPTLLDKIVQFRASGIRIKLPTFSPALNLVGTQIPIFPWVKLPKSTLKEGDADHGRYMTVREGARLQGMEKLKFGDKNFELSTSRCYEALGNAVNVTIVKMIAKKLLGL